MQILAKPLLEKLRPELEDACRKFESRAGRKAHLTVILIGNVPASQTYVAEKERRALLLGFSANTIRLPDSTTPESVKKLVSDLNKDPLIDGILIQRPLPPQFDESAVLQWVTPEKDVDVFHPLSVGLMQLGLESFLPCTPAGIMELLRFYKIPLSGKLACVIGRSQIVGKPIAQLLLRENATVIQAHSKTENLAELTRQCDIIISAIGRSKFLGPDHIKKGACVIDVGINRDANGKVVGDVDYELVAPICSAITPVPGGVGPMTIQMLFQNTLTAARLRFDLGL